MWRPVSTAAQGFGSHLPSLLVPCLLLAGLLVSGCAPMPAIEVDQQMQNQLRQLEHWRAQGKLGVRLDNEAHSANFDWNHEPDGFALRLSGPFGQGTTWLRREGHLVTLESPDTPLQTAASAEDLMLAQLGWQVPVSNLRYWIRGLAAPDQRVTHLARNDDGTLAELHQQGWTISYSRYGVESGWALPGKLVAQRDDIRLTVVVKQWQLPEPVDASESELSPTS